MNRKIFVITLALTLVLVNLRASSLSTRQCNERIHNECFFSLGLNHRWGGYTIYWQNIGVEATTIECDLLVKYGSWYYGGGLQLGGMTDALGGALFDIYFTILYNKRIKGRLGFYLCTSWGMESMMDCEYYFGNSIMDVSGIVPYDDLRAGLSFEIGNYSSLNIGYRFSLSPNYALSTAYQLFWYGFSVTNGMEISFRF